MAGKVVFVDTNILVYAHVKTDEHKHNRAQSLVKDFWHKKARPIINTQVLKEFGSALRKVGYEVNDTIQIISAYRSWNTLPFTSDIFQSGLSLWENYGLSYWDSFIVAAALHSGADELWSEDMQSGARFGDLVVVNPLREK